jgi:hypothetical protein
MKAQIHASRCFRQIVHPAKGGDTTVMKRQAQAIENG